MIRIAVMLGALSAVAGGASTPSVASRPWGECAEQQAVALLEQGVPASWQRTERLPAGEEIRTVELGHEPPNAVRHALMRTLHLVPRRNAFYLQRTGGFSGVNEFYGPVSLQGRCPAPKPGAP